LPRIISDDVRPIVNRHESFCDGSSPRGFGKTIEQLQRNTIACELSGSSHQILFADSCCFVVKKKQVII